MRVLIIEDDPAIADYLHDYLEAAGHVPEHASDGVAGLHRAVSAQWSAMLKLAAEYPEYAAGAEKVQIVETSSGADYDKGYQDVRNRVPKIENTMNELGWAPTTPMREALRHTFDAYRGRVGVATGLVE
jgi:nucleoside-diphosphate-sugar epimerase